MIDSPDRVFRSLMPLPIGDDHEVICVPDETAMMVPLEEYRRMSEAGVRPDPGSGHSETWHPRFSSQRIRAETPETPEAR